MRKFFLIPVLILFFALSVYAQPVNRPTFLVCDNITDPATVERSLVEANGDEVDAQYCIYQVMPDYTRLHEVTNYLPGPWAFRARVLGVSTGGIVGEWSGWSNTVTVTKPETAVIRIENGYLVVDAQPEIAISQIVINDGAVEQGLLEPVTGGVRVYDLSTLPVGTHNMWAQLVHVSGWEGDWPANPTVVTRTPAPAAPVLRIQVE